VTPARGGALTERFGSARSGSGMVAAPTALRHRPFRHRESQQRLPPHAPACPSSPPDPTGGSSAAL